MNTPGFTAETTLYRAAAYQTAAVVRARTANHHAYPQITLPPPLPPGRFTTCSPCDPTTRSQTCTSPLVAGSWQQPCTPCCSSEQACQQCEYCMSVPDCGILGIASQCGECRALKRSGECDKRC